MIGLRDIRVIESKEDEPPLQGTGAAGRMRKQRTGKTTGAHLMLGLLFAGCVLLVGWNMVQLHSKRDTASAKSSAKERKTRKIVIEDVEDDASSDAKENSDSESEPKHHHHHRHHHHHHHHEDTVEKKPPAEIFETLEERIEKTVQKSCSNFADLPPEAPHACYGAADIEEGWDDLFEKTGCDIFKVPFDPQSDEKCLELISDPENWKEVKPMKQEYDERTVKFKATFKVDPRLKVIIKVPQKLFPYEAMSEVGSYAADRVMNLNRVPPTAWVMVPVQTLEASAKEYGDSIKLIPRFAEDSKVTTFYEWVMKDFINYNRKKGLVTDDELVGVSVQLFIADVRPLLSSDLAIPWVAHNDSWQVHLSPSQPFKAKYSIGFIRQSELAMYDYVLGNGDRSPNKNNFVVGACRHHHTKSKCGSGPKHPGAPSFVTLDNGLMFMYELIPGRSPDGPNPLLKSSFCLFEKKLLARLKELHEMGFSVELEKVLPKKLKKFITAKLLHRCDHRLSKLLEQLSSCIDKYGEDAVVVA
eukprot:TRINITY_DN672_c1_g8_i1.p1 TRINITY_DN672_c1_g8~~TRINITY_DN672_c1_g8_i1.p1  ORF type:complete len:528 (+),score=98.49 TRINITY_DN672_c1_g8_i1:53-1636(+)